MPNYRTSTENVQVLRFGDGLDGGERGIRTLETLTRLAVFKTAAFNHSATSP